MRRRRAPDQKGESKWIWLGERRASTMCAVAANVDGSKWMNCARSTNSEPKCRRPGASEANETLFLLLVPRRLPVSRPESPLDLLKFRFVPSRRRRHRRRLPFLLLSNC